MANEITVIMPAYREKETQIRQAIESILCQTIKCFDFIIVLDDPENLELEKVIEEYKQKDSRILFYVNEKNVGCPAAKDIGIKKATTKYIAIMDADDIARPYRLEKEMNKIREECLDIVAGCVRVIDDNGKPLYNMDNLPLEHNKIVKKMRVNNCMPHPTWFLKRDVYLSLNGYADMQGCEDYDFLLRAIMAGYRLGTVSDIVLDYRLSSHSVSRNNLYKQYLMMNYIQDKYYHQKRLRYQSYEEYEYAKYDIRQAKKYEKSSIYFEKAMDLHAEKKYVAMIFFLIKSIFSSMEYTKKILKYVIQELG